MADWNPSHRWRGWRWVQPLLTTGSIAKVKHLSALQPNNSVPGICPKDTCTNVHQKTVYNSTVHSSQTAKASCPAAEDGYIVVCSQDGPCCGGENQGTTPHLQGVHLIATSWLKDADTRAYVQCNSLHGKLKEEARSVSGVGVKLAQVRGSVT